MILLQIGVVDEKQYDDAFTLQHVDEDLVEIFNSMAGMVPFIQKMIADVSSCSSPKYLDTALNPF